MADSAVQTTLKISNPQRREEALQVMAAFAGVKKALEELEALTLSALLDVETKGREKEVLEQSLALTIAENQELKEHLSPSGTKKEACSDVLESPSDQREGAVEAVEAD